MILSDREIHAAIQEKIILIDPPPAETLFTSTALDLTLDKALLRWNEPGEHPSGQPIKLYPFRKGFNIRAMMSDPNYSANVAIDPKHGFELEPHTFVLAIPNKESTCRTSRGSRQGSKGRAVSHDSASASM